MKNKIVSLMLLCTLTLVVTGCNKDSKGENNGQDTVTQVAEEKDETGFGITLEEQKICAEYAAGVLMKYNAGSNMRILEGKNLEIMELQEQKEREQEEKRQRLADEYQANKIESNHNSEEKKKESTSESSSKKIETKVSYIDDLSVATGTGGFSIEYTGYEVTDSYSEDGAGAFFAIDAVDGKVLLVSKFDVTNHSGQAEVLNLYSNDGKYKLNLDGNTYRAHQTLLLNDLSMYKEEIEAGETVETVLIFEIPQEKSNSIENMELIISKDDNVYTMLFEGQRSSVNVSDENVYENLDVSDEDTYENYEISDLAEEYEAALLREEAAMNGSLEENEQENTTGGNVTVVGSNHNISRQ